MPIYSKQREKDILVSIVSLATLAGSLCRSPGQSLQPGGIHLYDGWMGCHDNVHVHGPQKTKPVDPGDPLTLHLARRAGEGLRLRFPGKPQAANIFIGIHLLSLFKLQIFWQRDTTG